MESEQIFNFGIKGYVKPGFEHCVKELESLCASEDAKKNQLVIYVAGEKVVDVYGGVCPDSITNLYSTSKSIAAICLASLNDKGLF